MKLVSKIKRDGIIETVKAVKVNVFWWMEQQVLFHAPKLLPLAFWKPRFIYLEFTNNCNLNCEMCIRYGDRKTGYMTLDLLKKAVDQAASIGGVSLATHFSGESSLHPDYKEMIRYIVERKSRFYKLSITTNGTLFTREVAEAALGFDWVSFSVDGVGAVSETIRKGSNYETVKENIEGFLKLRGEKRSPIISTNTVISTQTDAQLKDVWLTWHGKVDNVNFSGCIDSSFHFSNMARYKAWNPGGAANHSKPVCTQPYTNLAVLWNGDIAFCCHDLTGKGVIGNLNEKSLMDIWRGTDRAGSSLCRKCRKYEEVKCK